MKTLLRYLAENTKHPPIIQQLSHNPSKQRLLDLRYNTNMPFALWKDIVEKVSQNCPEATPPQYSYALNIWKIPYYTNNTFAAVKEVYLTTEQTNHLHSLLNKLHREKILKGLSQ